MVSALAMPPTATDMVVNVIVGGGGGSGKHGIGSNSESGRRTRFFSGLAEDLLYDMGAIASFLCCSQMWGIGSDKINGCFGDSVVPRIA